MFRVSRIDADNASFNVILIRLYSPHCRRVNQSCTILNSTPLGFFAFCVLN